MRPRRHTDACRKESRWSATVLGSTIVFAPYSLEQALEGLAAAGYRNCEIGAVKGWFEHIDPDTATDKEIDRIAAS